ncbi:MAG: discoidin domain-containing protein, partial [Planctomycetota bacterium]
GPFYPGSWGCSTHAADIIYVHVLQWDEDERHLAGIQNRIRSASVMNGGPVEFEQTEKRITLKLAKEKQDPVDTVVVLEVEGPVTEMAERMRTPTVFDTGRYGTWISGSATYEMSSRAAEWSTHEAFLLNDEEYGNEFAFHTDSEKNPFIIIDLKSAGHVKGLYIVNRKGSLEERARSLTVWLSKDKTKWTRAWQAESAEKEWTVILDPAAAELESRHIKIGLNQDGKEYLHLHTVKVFGEM